MYLYRQHISIMVDKALETKKTLEHIVVDRKRIRIEKYNDIKSAIQDLDHTTWIILYNEFKRDFELDNIMSYMKTVVTMLLSFVTTVISVALLFLNSIQLNSEILSKLLTGVVFLMVIIILLYSSYDIYANRKKNKIKFIIDIFEEEK